MLEAKFEVFGEVQARFSSGRRSADVGATVYLTDVMETLKDLRDKVLIKP